MSYPTQALLTKAACDEVSEVITKKKLELVRTKENRQQLHLSMTASAATYDADMASVAAEIAVLETAIEQLAPGSTRVEYEDKQSRLKAKLARMQRVKDQYTIAAQFVREVQQITYESQIDEYDTVLSLIASHKAQLAA